MSNTEGQLHVHLQTLDCSGYIYAILYIKVLYCNELHSIMKGPILKITLDS